MGITVARASVPLYCRDLHCIRLSAVQWTEPSWDKDDIFNRILKFRGVFRRGAVNAPIRVVNFYYSSAVGGVVKCKVYFLFLFRTFDKRLVLRRAPLWRPAYLPFDPLTYIPNHFTARHRHVLISFLVNFTCEGTELRLNLYGIVKLRACYC